MDIDGPDVGQILAETSNSDVARATVPLTLEQRETLDRAIEKMREHAGEPVLSEGRCLELIAVDFLQSFEVEVPDPGKATE